MKSPPQRQPQRQRFRLGGGTGKKNQDFYENLENEKISKNIEKSMKIDKNIDFGGARNNRTWPSNSTRKTTYIDLFSCLYDRKWSKTLPVHVRKRSYVSAHTCTNASVFYALVLHIGVPPPPLLLLLTQRKASRNLFPISADTATAYTKKRAT